MGILRVLNEIKSQQREPEIFGWSLSYENLDGFDLSGIKFESCTFNGASLNGTNFQLCQIKDCDFGKANLTEANFIESNIESVNFDFANLDKAKFFNSSMVDVSFAKTGFFSIYMAPWPITHTPGLLQIGCQAHDPEEWWLFSNDEIRKMSRLALDWWRLYKPVLQGMVRNSGEF